MPLVTTLNGVPINDDTLAGKGYLTALERFHAGCPYPQWRM